MGNENDNDKSAEGGLRALSWVHPIGTRDGTLTRDARMVNMLPEQSENGFAAVKRFGMTLRNQFAAATAQGMFDAGGVGYAILGSVCKNISGGSDIVLTGQATTAETVDSLSNYAVGKSLLRSSSGMWKIESGVAVKVTSPGYPATTKPGLCELDGTFYVMGSDGAINGSAIQDPLTWDALNFLAPDAMLGAGVAVVRHLNYIVGLYDQGVQIFYDAGNATGSPLSPVGNASWRTGCAAAGSVVELGDELFFMSKAGPRGRSVSMLSGLQLGTISNPYIDRILNRDTLVGCRSFGIRTGGHSLYILTLPASNLTLYYDVVLQHWGQFTSTVAGSETAFVGCNYLNSQGSDLLQDATTGAVYTVDAAVWQDAGAQIACRIVTPPSDWGTLKRKRLPAVYLIADTVASSLLMRWSDDDYDTFSAYRSVDLSSQRKMLQRCGSSRRRSWEALHTANTPLRLFGYECEIHLGDA